MLLRRLLCAIRGHTYFPSYELRQQVCARGRHVRFQFRYECRVCGQWTQWMRRSHQEAWIKEHEPRWGEAPDFDEGEA